MTLKSQIERFSVNETNFNSVITGSSGATVDLGGGAGTVKTLASAIDTIQIGNNRGAWTTATAYAINDIVLESGAYYRCPVAHTSGVFATDLASGKWRLNQGGDTTILTHRGRLVEDVITARFSTVTAMIADVNLVVGDVVETFANQNGAVIAQKWEIVAAATGTPDGGTYINLSGSGLQAKQIFGPAITPSHFGAAHDESDYGAELQSWADYCGSRSVANERFAGVGVGTYFTASPVVIKSSFKAFGLMFIEPLGSYAPTTSPVILIDKSAAVIDGLRARNSNAVSGLTGFEIGQPEVKTFSSGAASFDRNVVVRDYSVTIVNGVGVNGGTGLSAYAPDSLNEINALNIIGGEYFGNSDYSMFIGDSRYTSAIIPTEFHGTNVKIIGATLDQGKFKADRVFGLDVQAYFEKGASPSNIAIELGGFAEGSLAGVNIHECHVKSYDYFVKCLTGVNDITVTKNTLSGVSICGLYLTTDQYPYKWENNVVFGSFGSGKPVHTGARSGLTSNFWNKRTIDSENLYNGEQTGSTTTILPNKREMIGNETNIYDIRRYRYYVTPFTANVTVSGTTATFTTPSEVANFNGGDAIKLAGGSLSYIRSVNYDAGTCLLNAASTSGVTTLEQQKTLPRRIDWSFEIPTTTSAEVQYGSVRWNTFATVSTPDGWVFKTTGWTAMA